MNYCSLDEAWGSMSPDTGNTNTQNYSSFEQQIKSNDTLQNSNNVNNSNVSNVSNPIKNIDLDNQRNKLVINSKMKQQQNRNIVQAGNPNQLQDRGIHINSIDKIIENLEKRVQLLENKVNGDSSNVLSSIFKSNNSSYEYIILIVVGIGIIFLLDKFLNKKGGIKIGGNISGTL